MSRRSERGHKETEKTDSDTVTIKRTDWKYVNRMLCTKAVHTKFLHGPPGVGKTYAAYNMGRNPEEVYAITLTPETPAAELRGMYIPHGNEFLWHDGPFTAAMRQGARLVINEIRYGSADVMALLHPVLESPMTARMMLPTQETVIPAPGFEVVATDNEPLSNLSGTLQERFSIQLEITEPHPDALAELSESLQRAARISLTLEPERAIGLRSWLAVNVLEPEFGIDLACRAVFGAERGAQIQDALALAQEEMSF